MVTFPQRVRELKGDFELALEERGVDYDEFLISEYIDQTRWTTVFRKVYKVDDTFYEIIHEAGSTEYQEEDYGYSVEVHEVRPVEKVVTEYLRV